MLKKTFILISVLCSIFMNTHAIHADSYILYKTDSCSDNEPSRDVEINDSESEYFSISFREYDNLVTIPVSEGESISIPITAELSASSDPLIIYAYINFTRNGEYLDVVFTPVTSGMALISTGFTGEFYSLFNGSLYSRALPVNSFSSRIAVKIGASNWIVLSGTYKTYIENVNVYKNFWMNAGISPDVTEGVYE